MIDCEISYRFVNIEKYIETLLKNKIVTPELRGRVAVISELKTSSDRELVQSFAGSCRTETLHNT